MRAPSTTELGFAVNDWNESESEARFATMVNVAGRESPCTRPGAFCRAVMADMRISVQIALAADSPRGHSSRQAVQPGGSCSQGGVKVPTGGKDRKAQARERFLRHEAFFVMKKGQQIRCNSEADG
jgi:hypothetical protein